MRTSQSLIGLLHIPSLFILVGYPIFWLELYVFNRRDGETTPLAWMIFFIFFLMVGWRSMEQVRFSIGEWKGAYARWDRFLKGVILLAGVGVLVMLACALYASFLPPHLMQESDVLNYHYTLPRQHLLRGDFQPIAWSSADLFLMPLQTALAPFWFATWLPNKIPQFFFMLGTILLGMKWVKRAGGPLLGVAMAGLAIAGSHAIGIQMGTAMLDLVIGYLFLATVDSVMEGRFGLALLEGTFCFWAKPLFPLQWAFVLGLTALLAWGTKNFLGFSLQLFPRAPRLPRLAREETVRLVLGFVVLSVAVAGPFILKSLRVAGTPLFPVGAETWPSAMQVPKDSVYGQSIMKSAQAHLAVRNAYGSGRSPVDFIEHIWFVAVPEKQVTNRFDYPLGLPLLLFVGPFSVMMARLLKKKVFPLAGVLAVVYWMSWWLSTQQSRFLYIPLILICVLTLMTLPLSRVLAACLLVAVGLNTLSVVRAHRLDWGRSREEVLRPQDKKFLEQNRVYLSSGRKGPVILAQHEVTFAQFPVIVGQEKLPFILAMPNDP